MTTRTATLATVLLLALSRASLVAQPIEPTSFHATKSPSTPVAIAGGNLLLGTRGSLPNTGTVAVLDPDGDFASLLLGLPYAGEGAYPLGDANGDRKLDVVDVFYLINRLFNGGPALVPTPFEPDGMAARGSTLYVATGEVVPSGQKASPARGAVLRVTFSAGLAFHEAFGLRAQDYEPLLAGQTVVLTHTAADTAAVSLLVNGVPAISGLTVDETTLRLYITSRADGSLSWVPIP